MLEHAIDRRFLVEKMPILFWRRPKTYERYIIQHGDIVEERIQKSGNTCEYELKTCISPQECTRETTDILKEEFDRLRERCGRGIISEQYVLSKRNPRISIHRYKGDYQGLVFAEVNFDSKQESDAFVPPSWMGTEITDSPLGRDHELLLLDREHFLRTLDGEMDNLHAGSQSFT